MNKKYFIPALKTYWFEYSFSLKNSRQLFFASFENGAVEGMSYQEEMDAAVDEIEGKVLYSLPLETAVAEAKTNIETISQKALQQSPEIKGEILAAQNKSLNQIKENGSKYEQLKALAVAGVKYRLEGEDYEAQEAQMDAHFVNKDAYSVNPENLLKLMRWSAELTKDAAIVAKMPAPGHEEQQGNLVAYLKDKAQDFTNHAQKIIDFWQGQEKDVANIIAKIDSGAELSSEEVSVVESLWYMLKNIGPDLAERMPTLKVKEFLSTIHSHAADLQKTIGKNNKLFNEARWMESVKSRLKSHNKEIELYHKPDEERKIMKQTSQELEQDIKEVTKHTVPESLVANKIVLIAELKALKTQCDNYLNPPKNPPTAPADSKRTASLDNGK